MKRVIAVLLCILLTGETVFAAQLVEVSVDAIEVGGTMETELGLDWDNVFNFYETEGESEASTGQYLRPIIELGEFMRTPIGAKLKTLIKDNRAHVLANPKLVTESGSQAAFLVGGEIPIPVASSTGVSLEWKTYGVNLQIKPEITKRKRIKALLNVSVSDLDYANAVTLQGYSVPAILQRSANTQLVLKDGGTVVIAGLRQTRRSTTKERVPVLGAIPVLGSLLFSYKQSRDIETSMIIFVTFRIVK